MDRTSKSWLSLFTCFLGVALFLVWQWLALQSYVKIDTRPPAWDQADHMSTALEYREALADKHWNVLWTLPPKAGMPPFPPLYNLAIMRAYDSPQPAQAALLVNWFYLALLCFSILGIAWEFKPGLTALAAALIFAGSPAIQELLLTQLMDLAVVALAAAAYWALIRSNYFKRWPSSLAFGLIYAVGMMHKWSFFSYLLPVFYIGGKTLNDKICRPKVLAAAFIALVGFLPWYIMEAPILLPRLVQASSDFAVPVWRQGAIFSYLTMAIGGLGLPFFLLGFMGLLAPQHRRNWDKAWLIPAWVLSSYLFWSIVPNRQMRFLLAGLPGLAVAVASAWPPALVWALAAFQVLTGINYPRAWIAGRELNVPFIGGMRLLPSAPPRAEDWHVADILKEAQLRHDPEFPIANLTLVANDTYFNGPSFAWMDEYLNLPDVRIRPVTHRLCELSEFVVLKKGTLGPAMVIGGLPEAAAIILDRSSWFSRSYEEVAHWPLPDGAHAVLFQHLNRRTAPFHGQSAYFQYYRNKAVSAKGFKINLGRWDAARGDYPRVTISAAEVLLRGLKVENVAAEFSDLDLVPAGPTTTGPGAWDDVRFLKLRRLRIISMQVSADDLRAFLEDRVKNLQVDSIDMDKVLTIEGKFGSIPIGATAALKLNTASHELEIKVLRANISLLLLPQIILERFLTIKVPLSPNLDTPFTIDIPRLTLKDGQLKI